MEDILTPIVFLVIGAVFIYVSVQFKDKRKMLLKNGVETEGVINSFDTSSGINSMSTTSPIIRFQTKEKKLIEQKASIAPPKFLLKEGQKVIVIYNPDNPTEYIFKTTSFDFSKMSYVALIFGVVFLLIGLWMTHKYFVS